MQRFIICILCTSIYWPSSHGAELPNQAQRLLDNFLEDVQEADKELSEVVEKAEAKHRETINKAVESTIKGFKRSLRSRSPLPEQIAIYRAILSLDQSDADATAFFDSIGTLDQVLADIEPLAEQDLVGNSVIKPTGNKLRARQAERMLKQISALTQEDWDALGGLTFSISARNRSTQIQSVQPGQNLLIVTAPGDRWSGGMTQPQVNALGNLAMSGINGPNMSLAQIDNGTYTQTGLATMLTVPAGGLFLGPNDGGVGDNSGTIRVKVFLVQ